MANEILPEDVVREIADLLGTSPRAVQMMSEEQVIEALVGEDTSLPVRDLPTCRHCGKPVSAWSVSMDGNHSWAHEHGGWYCVVDGQRPGTRAEPTWDDPLEGNENDGTSRSREPQ